MIFRPRYRWTAVVTIAFVSVTLASTAGLFGRSKAKPDRGLKSGHAAHVEQELDCATCHGWEEGGHVMPGHDLCSICHEIDEEAKDKAACNFCHTRADQSVDPLVKRMSVETIFGHEPHIDASIACTKCHETPGVIPDLPKGPLMPWCMECHSESTALLAKSGEADAAFLSNDCTVCHRELTAETRPKFRGGARIAHDVPELWMKIHGHEAQFDPQYCATCHDTVASCEDCHRREKPRNHTIAWRRKPHGLRALIDQKSCSTCHEEEFCVKCHENTEPKSHRGGFGGSLNRHCVSCHFQPQNTSCTVCHEDIEHRTSGHSPHEFGIFPSDCAECHPGGLPNQAPHLMNNSVSCRVCHQ